LAHGAEEITQDEAELLSGGFAIAAASTPPVGMLPQPENLHASYGDLDGEVDLGCNAIKRGVQSYVVENATSADGPFTQFYIGKASKSTCTGLTSGTEYWFRVRAIGAAGPSQWSEKTSSRAT
jgi:hypothetical protein